MHGINKWYKYWVSTITKFPALNDFYQSQHLSIESQSGWNELIQLCNQVYSHKAFWTDNSIFTTLLVVTFHMSRYVSCLCECLPTQSTIVSFVLVVSKIVSVQASYLRECFHTNCALERSFFGVGTAMLN